jgi:hypothetical protein
MDDGDGRDQVEGLGRELVDEEVTGDELDSGHSEEATSSLDTRSVAIDRYDMRNKRF